ncbi:LptF/LptG family permease [Limibacter armeniacum]|uniref:LptF/LptG family permease n=1 Tax=Limibacter armeniacum TaxID=466084 RepID=UPI002FE649FF
MKILDKYILKKFFKTFFFVVLTLNVIVCVIDYTEKSDDFIKNNLSFNEIFFDYYVNLFVHWVSTLSPISVFIAVVFLTARLASHSEVIAILTNGISFRRFLSPFLMGATLLGGLTFLLIGWVIPKASRDKVEFEVAYLKPPFYFNERDIHMRVDDSTYMYMESYNNRIDRGYRSTIETIRDNRLYKKISGPRIEWDSAKQLWRMDKYDLYTFGSNGEETMVSGKNMEVDLHVNPKYFDNKYKLEETLTIPELNDYIKQEKLRGNVAGIGVYMNAKHERYAYPFAIIILTALGVIVSARKTRQGSGFLIAMGFVLAFVYILLVIMGRSIAQAGSLDPMLTAWLPNMLFFGITSILYYTLPK